MSTPNEPDLAERLEDAIGWAEHHVRSAIEAATESDSWTLGDYLCEHKPAIAGQWIERVEELATIGFYARAIAWAELVALRDGAGSVDSSISEAPQLTLADLDKEYPYEGIDEITEEERDPDDVHRERVGQCQHFIESQLQCLSNQSGHLARAASVGSTDQVVDALEAIDRTASAMARAYGLWMRHLEPIWSPPISAPDDILAEYGDWTAFAPFINAE